MSVIHVRSRPSKLQRIQGKSITPTPQRNIDPYTVPGVSLTDDTGMLALRKDLINYYVKIVIFGTMIVIIAKC